MNILDYFREVQLEKLRLVLVSLSKLQFLLAGGVQRRYSKLRRVTQHRRTEILAQILLRFVEFFSFVRQSIQHSLLGLHMIHIFLEINLCFLLAPQLRKIITEEAFCNLLSTVLIVRGSQSQSLTTGIFVFQ